MKHLIDVDEGVLRAAQRRLGTPTIKATVNEALRWVAGRTTGGEDIDAALDVLAAVPFDDRADAWR